MRRRASGLHTCLLLALFLSAGTAAAATDPATRLVEKTLSEQLIEQAKRDGLHNPVIEVTAFPAGEAAPSCAGPKVEIVDMRYLSRMRVALRCPGADGKRHEFVARAKLSAEIIVAARALPAGHVIEDNDLLRERRDVSGLRGPLSERQAVVGLILRRAVRPGQVIRKQMLMAPLLVRRGEVVTIVATSGPVMVSMAGEALDAGRSGAIVRVRNAGTGKVIRARVTGRATVEPIDIPLATSPQSPY